MACDDGNKCTRGDTCRSGQCTATPFNCNSVCQYCNGNSCSLKTGFGFMNNKCTCEIAGGLSGTRRLTRSLKTPSTVIYQVKIKGVVCPFQIATIFNLWETRWPNGWRSGLRIERSGFEPRPGHCVMFLGKTLYSHSASLHPGVSMGTSKLSGKPDELLEITCDGLASHPGGVAIFLVTSCYGNRAVWATSLVYTVFILDLHAEDDRWNVVGTSVSQISLSSQFYPLQ